jgi:DNA-binding transcriptional ArsR family regulator
MTAKARLDSLPQHRPAINSTEASLTPSDFDWAGLAALSVHPTKVAIIEALRWVGEPLSAAELAEMMKESDYSHDMIIYHANSLTKLGALDLAHTRRVRGTREHFYRLPQEAMH